MELPWMNLRQWLLLSRLVFLVFVCLQCLQSLRTPEQFLIIVVTLQPTSLHGINMNSQRHTSPNWSSLNKSGFNFKTFESSNHESVCCLLGGSLFWIGSGYFGTSSQVPFDWAGSVLQYFASNQQDIEQQPFPSFDQWWWIEQYLSVSSMWEHESMNFLMFFPIFRIIRDEFTGCVLAYIQKCATPVYKELSKTLSQAILQHMTPICESSSFRNG